MNGFDKIQLWASLIGVVLILGGIAVAVATPAVGLGIILVVVGLVAAWIGKIAVGAREQAAQNALINRK